MRSDDLYTQLTCTDTHPMGYMVLLEAGLQAQVYVAALAYYLTLPTALPAHGTLDALPLLVGVHRPMAFSGSGG